LTGVGDPAGSVTVAIAQSPADVRPVTLAVTPEAVRSVITPVTTNSSPSWTGLTNLTLAVPRPSQAGPSASTTGRVR
jgi:hypothetical protein